MFTPGQSGNPAGRKPGSKNKLSYKKDVWETCVDVGVDPFRVLAEIAAGILRKPKGTPERIAVYLRKEAAAELCQYIKPKLKSMEIKGDSSEEFSLIINTVPFKAQVKHNEEETNEEPTEAIEANDG